MQLNDYEREAIAVINELKGESGSHSPSLYTLRDRLPDIDIKVDACFLSNPYATDVFIERLTSDLVETGELRRVLELYPSQNQHIAALLEGVVGVDQNQIFLCNGAVEAIQAALHRFAGTRVAVILPTFSPYYEYLRPDQRAFYYRLQAQDDFALDLDDFIAFVADSKIDTICLINPNNPNGGYVPAAGVRRLLNAFADLRLVILDESFIDFAYEDEQRNRTTLAVEAAALPNVMVVKSMSKDFGIAGVRAGYAIMSKDRVANLLSNGYLWNLSGLSEFFFRILAEPDFQEAYASARLRYLSEASVFFEELARLDRLRAYSTMANFCLVELDASLRTEIVAPLLLIRHGVYIRDCRDKRGLEDGQYIRIAGRKDFENEIMINALKDVLSTCGDSPGG
jgi:histidinol-phosphate/aromatic aminotransferase/cobyric acid decarboxylase-like protein